MYGYEIFHPDVAESLIKSVRNNTFSHAYIFSGEKGSRILEAARLFANALVCESPSASPCGYCEACRTAIASTNPDIITMDTGSKKSIGVDDIRKVNDDVFIKPFSSAAKVYIINDADMMTEQAQNAFLKTLEEPPSYAVFILICGDISSMLQTIISRCTIVKFGKIKNSELKKYILEKYGSENADFLISISDSNPQLIDEYASGGEYKELRESSVKTFRLLLSSNPLSIYSVSDFLESNKEHLSDILNFWIVLIRDILLLSHSEHIVNSDILKFLRNQEAVFSDEYLINAANVLATAHEMCGRYVNHHAISMYITIKIKSFSKQY